MDDDWCLLSDDDEFVSVASLPSCTEFETELEPEPDLPPTLNQVKPRPVDGSSDELNTVDVAISLDDIDISTLLQDSAALCRSSSQATTGTSTLPVPEFRGTDTSDVNAGVSLDDIDISTLLEDSLALRTRASAFSLSLLSSEHRRCRSSIGRCVEVTHSSSPNRGGSLAFSAPRSRSFVARLRAEMPSRRSHLAVVEPPVFASLVVLTQDQSTQCDIDADVESLASTMPEPWAARLTSTLKRSMDLSKAVKTKSQDLERLAFQLTQTQAQGESNEHQHARDVFKLGRLESGLQLAKKREKRYVGAQTALEAQVRELRQQNAELLRINAFQAQTLSAADVLANVPRAQSIDDLERLEVSLAKAMDAVRTAVRAKYKLSIVRQQQLSSCYPEAVEAESMCVVCHSEPATVVLVPCRHQVLCSACAIHVTKCPVDREVIHDKVLTFGLSASWNEETKTA